MGISDDGRWLDLETIKKLGVGKKLIEDDESDPKAISNLIFNSGLSTASTLSDISGRGVGMGAIRSYVNGGGGQLSMRFLQKYSSLEEPLPIEFSLILDSKMFVVADVSS